MRYVINIAAICIVVIVIVMAINLKNNASQLPFHNEIKRFFKEFSAMIEAKTHNIGLDVSPSRRKNITFIEQEEKLRQFVPWVFGEFKDSDWKKFWAYIYDPVYDKKSKYGRKRYRTAEEIRDYLCRRYPVFESFDAGHWSYFWSIIDVDFENK